MNRWMMGGIVVAVAALAAVAMAEPAQQPQQGGGGNRPMVQRLRERVAEGERGGMDAQNGREMALRALMQNPELAAKAGITEEQLKSVREAAFAQREELVRLRAAAETSKLKVERLLAADKVDKDAVMKAIDAAGLDEVAIKKAEIGFELRVKEMLGDEAIKKVRNVMREHFAERRASAMREGGDERQGPPQRQGARGGAPWQQDRMEPPPPAPEQ